MNDLISRQSAEAIFRNARTALFEHREKIKDFDTRDLMLTNAEQMIHLLPSVEPKQEWISVEDRLPEEYGEYMITWVSDQTNKPLISIAEYEITDDFDRENCRFLGEWLFDEYMSAYTNIKVTAWCELPEPYKGDKENK